MIGKSISGGNNDNSPFPGKIAVITSDHSLNEDDYHSADQLLAKYGTDKILRQTWPIDFMAEPEQVVNMVAELASDREIKVLILNQAVPGSNAAVDKLKETRDDIFIIFCTIHEPTQDAAARANLILGSNEVEMGSAMVKQVQKQGAKVFVHYSFPRHMAISVFFARREMMRDICAAEGIQFIDVTALDPAEKNGISAAHKFISEDVPKMVAKYGENTAFFCTNCTLQIPLIKAVIENHAIYPQPCCPSPYHGFPEALGIDAEMDRSDLYNLISETSRIAEEKNMTDRLSTWPVSASSMSTTAGAEYAIKWINGEVTKTGIDGAVLMDCMNTYIEAAIGEESCVFMNPYTENGITYNNYKQILMSYLDF